MRKTAVAAVLFTSGLVLAACGSADNGDAEKKDFTIAATTTPLGSVVDDIAKCADGKSITIMNPGSDPHSFSPSSEQVADMVKSDLVVANGLGLESGLQSAIDQAKADNVPVMEAAAEADPIPFGEDGHDHDHAHESETADEHAGHDHAEEGHDHAEEGHDHAHEGEAADPHAGHNHGSEDPHFWLDAARMSMIAKKIGERAASESGNDKWKDCGVEVSKELDKVNDSVKETLNKVPEDRRVIVTDHDAFGYFNQAYGFKSEGVVIPGGSTQAEPSSAELSALAKTIKENKVPAIFSNTAIDSKLVDAVAKEAGTEVKVVPLHVGSVGEEGSDAATYAGMMESNAKAIADALS
ncbi:metal ABC transporter substrate-binding protein [Corynebacterium ulceribovis]|uniref:metal ABC transporter substrate-binding protein n=1 Tax=Corynebacterium ulceribovis TaxID=487732 RepID=UPI000361625C|nr:metal ABC transporter substrate-binding protein [Corynebacterium ulceribovis]